VKELRLVPKANACCTSNGLNSNTLAVEPTIEINATGLRQ
jgi:hypothetical protein